MAAMSLWRNSALSSKLSLASSARTLPSLVTTSGLISASEASVSIERAIQSLQERARLRDAALGNADLARDVVGFRVFKPALGEVPCDGVVPLSTHWIMSGDCALGRGRRGNVPRAGALCAAVPGCQEGGDPPAGGLRGFFEARLELAVRTGYEAALESLAKAGVALSDVEIPHAPDAAAIYLGIVLPEASAYHAATLERCPELYSPAARIRLEMGRYVLAEN